MTFDRMEKWAIEHNNPMRSLGRPAVLVAEDESLIGLDLCETLESAGYRVIGPLASGAEASAAVRDMAPDLAVVDYMLRDGPCIALVQALRERGMPFLVNSGYRREIVLGLDLGDTPWMDKPAASHDLLLVLGRLEHLIPRIDTAPAALTKPANPSDLPDRATA